MNGRGLFIWSAGNLVFLSVPFLLAFGKKIFGTEVLAGCDLNHYVLTPVTLVTGISGIMLLILILSKEDIGGNRNYRYGLIFASVATVHFILQNLIFLLALFQFR